MQHSDLKTLLKQTGYKITKPRLLVLSLLRKSANPLSAKEITGHARKLSIDQATIYRTLELFKKAGLIQEINLQENRAYFELKDSRDHHHIICVECKKIEDFNGCDYQTLADTIIKQHGDFAKITNHSFEFFGICKSCV